MTREELETTVEQLLHIKQLQEELISVLKSEVADADAASVMYYERCEALKDRIREMEETQQWAVAVCYADGRTAGVADSPEKAVELGLKTWRAATLGTRQDITKVCCLNQHREVVFYFEG